MMDDSRTRRISSLLRRMRQDQCGQVLASTAVLMIMLLAVCCVALDFGQVYIAYRQLRASTDAAALAAAQNMNLATATNATVAGNATAYSSMPTGKNQFNTLTNVTLAVTPRCASVWANSTGVLCISIATANATLSANVVKVVQNATVPLTFAGLFGKKTANLSVTSTASMRNGARGPYNVALILDTTASMNSGSTAGCTGNPTPVQCALQGMQTLLGQLSPCLPSVANCPAAPVSQSIDQVSLFVFPAWEGCNPSLSQCIIGSASNSVPSAWGAAGYKSPTGLWYYSFLGGGLSGPNASNGTIVSGTAAQLAKTPAADGSVPNGTLFTYQLIPFSHDYRMSDSSGLYASSELVKMAQNSGFNAPGGAGTYYAGVIYAAQNALAAEQAGNPGSQNVMIILTDGDATSTSGQMFLPNNATNTYQSYHDECQQAIIAANAASAAGTTVYAIGFGSGSSGCSSDSAGGGGSNLHLTYGGTAIAYPPTPCQTIEYMATSPNTWFSDLQSKNNGCTSAAQPFTNVPQIFTAIVGQLTAARLIPNNTT